MRVWSSRSVAPPAAPVVPPSGDFLPNFPVIGGYYIGGPTWASSTVNSKLAPLALVVFDHYYTTEANNGVSMSARMAAIKALTPAGVGATPIHTIYNIIESITPVTATWWSPVRDKIVAENWFMRNPWSGGTGAIVANWFGGGNEAPNMTGWAHVNRKDGLGYSFIDWYCEKYAKAVHVTGGSQFGQTITPNPNLGAIFLDNSFWQSRDTGDYNQSGVSVAGSDAGFRASWQDGMIQYAAKMRAILPNFPIMGNMDFCFSDSGLYDSSYTPNYSPIGSLYGLWDGGLGVEYLTSDSREPYALEYQERSNGLVGFQAMRNQMHYYHYAVRDPRKVSYSLRDVLHDGTSADNQRLRFGVGAILTMSNGIIDDRGSIDYDSAYYGIYTNNGAGHGWLGQPVSGTPVWTSDGAGVYKREFTYGYSAVNPRNNGSRNFTLPVNVRNIVTSTNYTAGTNIPLADRDGALLLKY